MRKKEREREYNTVHFYELKKNIKMRIILSL